MSKTAETTRPWGYVEPSIDELLTDGACLLLMKSDGTSPQAVSALLERMRSRRQDVVLAA